MANDIQRCLRDGLQPENTRVTKPAKQNIYLLYKLEMPAVTVECGFLSNAVEATLLASDGYQNSLAACIANGINSYFNVET